MFTSVEQLLGARDTIFVDTCSLMADGFATFMEQIRNFLVSRNKQLTIPVGVIEELDHIAEELSDRGKRAMYALEMVNKYKSDHLVIIHEGELSALRPDDFFLAYSSAKRSSERILILTQDYLLCRAILRLNQEIVGYGYSTVYVKRVRYNGELSNFDITQSPNAYTRKSKKSNADIILAKLLQY